ncbi:MAG: translation initiation factor IF-2 subunit beta [Candidatus Thermoplasmatota archaeon]
MDYKTLLLRAKEKLPKDMFIRSRFEVPKADVFYEGKNTVVKNFCDIAGIINREPKQIFVYLLREIGTAGTMDGKRIIFKGKVNGEQIDEKLNNYVATFVLCDECKRPDTRIVKEGRTTVLECDACGAHRPITVIKTKKREEAINVGAVIEVLIEDLSERGDGIAKKGGYVIFVPGTLKGSQVKVKIEDVRGTVAFGRVTKE